MSESKTIILRSEKQVDYAKSILVSLPKDEQKPIWVIIFETYEAIRSKRFNSYYWVCLTHIASCKPTGSYFNPESFHEFFGGMFLEPNISYNILTGAEIRSIPSTTKLGSKKFKKYFEDIQEFCLHEWFVILPDPKQHDMEYIK
ncbi:hypothetical protein [Dyadobacter psychrotolerans]|uniref:Uncharacterized protein n=1 Tax=Dyadobacter psychrotolerans TaxID=2541721 RepID=A0A4R5DV39_9BACT|nr:hypothetical protein [Dyadobacter psychrotolerans]TDE17677.1 hypothetical protein E0F88_07245 [Dyadobacter psychrotolerans]